MIKTIAGLALIASASAVANSWEPVFEAVENFAEESALAAPNTLRRPLYGDVKICNTGNAHAKNLIVNITPENPKPNDKVITTFEYDLDKEVTGGKAKYSATIGGIPLTPTVTDLCEDQAGGQNPCPLKKGRNFDRSEAVYPNVSGKVVSKIEWFDQDGEDILCVQWTVKN